MKLELIINDTVAETWEFTDPQIFGPLSEMHWIAKRDFLEERVRAIEKQFADVFRHYRRNAYILVSIESNMHLAEISDEEMQEFELSIIKNLNDA